MNAQAFAGIVDQPLAVEALSRAIHADRVASAYLFEGPSGVGKELTAMALAEAMLARHPGNRADLDDQDVGRRVREGHHPDVRVFRPRDEGHRNVQVEFVRAEILPFAQYAPFEAGAAFLIFPEADVSFPAAHPESGNALLKTLEEPRPGVHFVLLSERPDRLLATIRSRTQRLRFRRLSAATLSRIIDRQTPLPAQRSLALALADGRADRALLFASSSEERDLVGRALALDDALATGRPADLIVQAEQLARDDDLTLILEVLGVFYRDVCALSLDPATEVVLDAQLPRVRNRAATLRAGQAASRVEAIRRTTDSFERNANRELALDALFLSLGCR